MQRVVLNVTNMDAGHIEFGRKLQANKKDFTFNVVTLGGTYGVLTQNRIIGGYLGMRPVFVDAVFGFQEGVNSRESMQIIIDTEFLDFPDMPLPT